MGLNLGFRVQGLFFLFLITSLLRFHLYTKHFTRLDVPFNSFQYSRNNHHNHFKNISSPPKETLCPLVIAPITNFPQPLITTYLLSASMKLPLPDISYKWSLTIICWGFFCNQLLLLGIVVSKFTHVVASFSTSFLSVAK